MGCLKRFHVALQLLYGGTLVVLVRCDGGKALSLLVLHAGYSSEAFVHVVTEQSTVQAASRCEIFRVGEMDRRVSCLTFHCRMVTGSAAEAP